LSQSVSETDTFELPMSDGETAVVHRWLPDGEPRAVVQIAHGASEHGARYARLAGELTKAGYAVYADDHRGHGRTAGQPERFGIAGDDGWNRLLEDQKELTDNLTATHPGKPIVLLGHSMGSFIAQGYLQRWGDRLKGAILTGSAASLSDAAEGLGEKVAEAAAKDGRDMPSMDFAMLFLNFNDPFVVSAPGTGPTGFEWLSRDQDEVQKYVDDPWCGLPLSNGFVADMAAGLEATWADGADRDVPADLPVLIMAGDEDPVGGSGVSVRELSERYRAGGRPVTEHLYRGARHEIFNETNRDQVHTDLLAWLDDVTR
jgi:alpha-beta hydrolase superfamily lysophospholipase